MSYIGSISPQDIITEIMISYTTNIEQLCSTGSSGSLFYYTRDAKYIMKTIPQREFEVLKRILPNYYRYLKENKWTLLPKYYMY
jgi:1-phosphatidylinositol-4-phosphate 5-kinase